MAVGLLDVNDVTPLAGVWIEISSYFGSIICDFVTPLAGVWIEITYDKAVQQMNQSLPSRECGLKYGAAQRRSATDHVTPLAGVWIEIITFGEAFDNYIVTPLAGVWIEIEILSITI